MDDLQHFGVLGMHWGRRKAVEVAPTVSKTIKQQAYEGLRREAGRETARVLIKNYGHLVVPATKSAAKGSFTLLKYSSRVAKGSVASARILGSVVKGSVKFGKVYVRGAIAVAKLVK